MSLIPVLLKELRSQVRGRRAMFALTGYLGILLLTALAVYAMASSASEGLEVAETGESIGKGLFLGLSLLQASLVVLLAPAFTAGAISQEREQKTFDLLKVTLVDPISVVLGKLAASLAYLAVVLIASLPIMALGFLFGGVEPGAVALVLAVQMLLALTFGAVGIFYSSFSKRTLWSTVWSYATIFVVVAVLPIVDAAVNAASAVDEFQPLLLYLNPLPLVMSVSSAEFAEEIASSTVAFTLVTPVLYLVVTAVLLVAATYLVSPSRPRRSRG